MENRVFFPHLPKRTRKRLFPGDNPRPPLATTLFADLRKNGVVNP
jgi:hypothetical protein